MWKEGTEGKRVLKVRDGRQALRLKERWTDSRTDRERGKRPSSYRGSDKGRGNQTVRDGGVGLGEKEEKREGIGNKITGEEEE